MSDYTLVRQDIGGEIPVLVLKDVKDKDTFLSKLANSHRTKFAATRLIRNAKRVLDNGTEWGIESETLKILHGVEKCISLFELRAKGKCYRIMTYIHNDSNRTPVLLSYFEAHQIRAKGGIPDAELNRGIRLAMEAQKLMCAEEELR